MCVGGVYMWVYVCAGKGCVGICMGVGCMYIQYVRGGADMLQWQSCFIGRPRALRL